MVALALDIGQTRIGVAVSDRTGRVAMPVKVLPAAEVTGMARSFRLLLEDHEPDILVCGLPKTMAGEEGPQAERVRAVGEQVARLAGLPLAFADERLSSREAKRILREEGLSERQMRGKIDMLAASLFLQAWLDDPARSIGDARSTLESRGAGDARGAESSSVESSVGDAAQAGPNALPGKDDRDA